MNIPKRVIEAEPQHQRGTKNGIAVASLDNGILSAVGHTPLIQLNRVLHPHSFQLYAKLEGMNPGGSAKDRAALYIIQRAITQGIIKKDTIVVESSSGNMAIGLAQACLYFGLKFICVVDKKTNEQNLQLLRALGAVVEIVTQPDHKTGEYLPARLARVQEIRESLANTYWPNQYANMDGMDSHFLGTMPEIVAELNGRLDFLFCAVSTCGTVAGCSRYVREHKLSTKIIAVDAKGSKIFGGGDCYRLLPGHGASIRPPLVECEHIDRVIHVRDIECVVGCRRLLKSEAIMAGASSGGALMAVEAMKAEIPAGAVCAVILHDRGERYLDTVFSDIWVRRHFGEVFDAAVPLREQWEYSISAATQP
jgi:2,3-diaminopropionate biosynthesis protein SbnA